MSKSSLFSYLLLGSLSFSSVAFAATTGSVTLGGTVVSSLEMTSEDTGEASNLDLSGGQKIAHVADIAMATNNEQGLTLTASGSGALTKSGGSTISFLVTSVDDGALAPAAGVFAGVPGADYQVGTGIAGAVAKDLYILYAPATLQDPGDYAGEIDLEVTDN